MSYFTKNSFLFLLATGAALSVLVRMLFGDSSVVSLLAIGICLACLSFYYRRVLKQGGAGMHGPDNCYYMGLLFTLVSLIYSLIALFLFNVGGYDVAERTNNLIGSFGIALFSTFAGILFRILLLQQGRAKAQEDAGARSPGSIEILTPRPSSEGRRERPPALSPATDDASQTSEMAEVSWHRAGAAWNAGDVDLTEAALKLRLALSQTTADMCAFRKSIVQAANETRVAMAEQAKKAAEEQTKTLSNLSATAIGKLTETVDEIAASVHEELAQTMADMNAARNAISRSSDETVQAANRARIDIIQQAEKAAAEHTETLSNLSTVTVAKLSGIVDELTDSIGGIKNALADLSASHAKQAARVDDSSQKITSGGEKLAASFAPMVEALQGVVESLQSTNRDTQAVFANYDSLNAKLRQSVSSFNQIQHEIEQSAKGLAASTEQVSRSLVQAAESAPQYAEQFQEMTAALQRETEKWQSMTEEVRTSLVQAVNKLTEVIKGSS